MQRYFAKKALQVVELARLIFFRKQILCTLYSHMHQSEVSLPVSVNWNRCASRKRFLRYVLPIQ
jgi:hypothetical protein